MSFVTTIKEYIPPILLRLLKHLFNYQKTYNSYFDALIASSSLLGYEDPYLVKTIYEETKEYNLTLNEVFKTHIDQTIIHTLLPFSIIQPKDILHILDIGGACGIHYFPIKKILGEKYKFKWTIVETNALTNIAKDLENEELKFCNNINDAIESLEKIDLIIASGAIQYLDNPKKTLTNLTNLGAEYILLTRLSLTQSSEEIITVQKSLLSQNSFEKLPNGFSDRIIKYPHTTMKETDFESIIYTNYDVKLHFDDESGIQKINNKKCIGYGLLLQKKLK